MSSSYVGVDVGGTKMAAALLSRQGLSTSTLHASDLSSREALLDQLVELVREVADSELRGVGVGVPSTVEFETGRVVSSVNVPLTNVPLRQVLSDRLGVPVFVDNDATVAALAEAHDADLQLIAQNLVMLTVGTGVGGGLVLGGRIYRGATGGAGELGHTIVGLSLEGEDAISPGTSFPQPGSLEAVAAGPALGRFAAEAARLYPDSALGRIAAEGRVPTGEDARIAAQAGDEVAIRTVESWAERVGIGIANAINTFDPDEVVLGGGAALAGEMLLGPATRIARAYVHPGLSDHAMIRLARHGVRAGVLGAALLARDELEPAGGRASESSVERPTTEVLE